MIERTLDFIRRNGLIFLLAILTFWHLKLEFPEIRAFLFVVASETIAIAFSGISAYVFTKVKFTDKPESANLGLIFLAVHICVGLTLLSVYLAQFGA